jgi:hypothetical protein
MNVLSRVLVLCVTSLSFLLNAAGSFMGEKPDCGENDERSIIKLNVNIFTQFNLLFLIGLDL